jgi:hypothetical protein
VRAAPSPISRNILSARGEDYRLWRRASASKSHLASASRMLAISMNPKAGTLHDSLGTPLGTVQALLGHSSSEITRQVYLHSLTADRRTAAEKLEALLIGPNRTQVSLCGQLSLPEFVGAEEVIGRGEEI